MCSRKTNNRRRSRECFTLRFAWNSSISQFLTKAKLRPIHHFPVSRQKVKGVWISRASTYMWLQQPARWISQLSSSSTHPQPNRSTCTPTCPCASEGGVTLVMTGHQTQTPTCRRGLEEPGRWLIYVPSVMTSKKHQSEGCPRHLGEIYHTGAFSGLWPVSSYWTLTCTGRHM